jgi:hypothetical protein
MEKRVFQILYHKLSPLSHSGGKVEDVLSRY